MQIPIVKKTHFDELYQQKINKLKAIKPEDCEKSPWYGFQTLSGFEVQLQFFTGFMISIGLFIVLGFKCGILVFMITQSPNSLFLVDYIGHGPKCIFLCGFFLWFCTIIMVFLKRQFYGLIALVYGLECFTDQDDLYNIDMKAHNIIHPFLFVAEKPKGNLPPAEYFKKFLDQGLKANERTMCKIVKVWGKWFIRNPRNLEERHEYYRQNAGVIEDLVGEQQTLDFMCKLKSCWIRHDGFCAQKYFYLPNYSETEVAYMFLGHHSLMDGRGAMQLLFKFSDDPHNTPYPFLNLRTPNLLQWLFMYITFPVKFAQLIMYYFKKKKDINCIKRHPMHLTGELQARNLTMDLNKVKALAKKNGVTLNDLIMAFLSMGLQRYFELKGDKQKDVTIMIPFSFKEIPKDVSKYYWGNKFAGMTLYLKLEKELSSALKYVKNEASKTLRAGAGAYYIGLKMYVIFYPLQVLAHVVKNAAMKHTLVFTNVACFQRPVYYGGGMGKEFYYLAGANGSLATGVTLVSTMDRIKLTVSSDKSQVEDIDEFVNLFGDLMIKEHGLELQSSKKVD